MMDRRRFMKQSAGAVIGASILPLACGGAESGAAGAAAGASAAAGAGSAPLFRISLAEWSLHKALYANELTNLDFPRVAKADYGIDAVEYVNGFFKDKARDRAYLGELNTICEGEGVTSVLIMCDGEGRLGDPDDGARTTAVENHYRWIDAAKFLGCHSIRVNAASEGDWDTQMSLAADGLRRLAEKGAEQQIGVIVENHGGLSSNGAWLSGVMDRVDHPNCGTLPDFGNFRIAEGEMYDIYQGIEELMPYAKAVSAKSHNFDDAGNERDKDYTRIMRIVLDVGYRGFVGVEYEGTERPEPEGIRLTKALLERVRTELTPEYT